MISHFGYEGTMALLLSGALEIRCECAQFGEGQFGTPACPPLTFQFHVIEAPVRDQYVINNLSEVNRSPGLTSWELMALQSAVMKAVRQPDNREMFKSSIAPAFEHDVLHNSPLLKTAVRHVLQRDKGLAVPDDFNLAFHKVGDDRYTADTDLMRKANLSLDDVHQVLKVSVLGVSGVDQRLGEMKAHNALSGFTGEELALFRSKLDSLADLVGSHAREGQFQRVFTVAGLQSVTADSHINIHRLLEIRNEPEAIEFRGWITDLDKYSEEEIRDRVGSFNTKLGLAAQTTTGKTLRFLITAAVGVYHPVAGLTLGVLDQFAWDRFACRSGAAAFIHELYPSIFG